MWARCAKRLPHDVQPTAGECLPCLLARLGCKVIQPLSLRLSIAKRTDELARIERAAALVRDQSAMLRSAFLDAWIRTYAASIGAGSEPGTAAVLAAGAVDALNQYLNAERKPL